MDHLKLTHLVLELNSLEIHLLWSPATVDISEPVAAVKLVRVDVQIFTVLVLEDLQFKHLEQLA